MIYDGNWQAIRDFISGRTRFLVTTHVHPDGDAIGSQMAIAHYLRQMGKKVLLINCDPTPPYFQFLDAGEEIAIYDPEMHDAQIATVDGCIVVDISDWKRLAGIGRVIQRHQLPVACIDHHIPTDDMGEVHVCVQEASSTGEMVYDFLMDSKADWTPAMVDAVYAGILTDTGSFRFSNTTAKTHVIAADLLNRGAHYRAIYEEVYEKNSKQRTLLMARLLQEMHFECEDRLAYFSLSQQMLRETGAELWETEGFSELPRHIARVEVSLMFTETADGHTKVSFRSKGRVAINGMASLFGGGGHKYASGATLATGLQETVEMVVREAKKLFS